MIEIQEDFLIKCVPSKTITSPKCTHFTSALYKCTHITRFSRIKILEILLDLTYEYSTLFRLTNVTVAETWMKAFPVYIQNFPLWGSETQSISSHFTLSLEKNSTVVQRYLVIFRDLMPLFLECKFAEKDSSNQEYNFPIPPKRIYHQYYDVLSPFQVFIETSPSENLSSSRLQPYNTL